MYERSACGITCKNLKGITRVQFNDILTHIQDITLSKSGSIRFCVAVLLVNLKCAFTIKKLQFF